MTERSPLHEVHARLGARFVDFGGWEMPVQYESVIAEHMAVRERAGWFDVSHLGRFEWRGPDALDVARRLLCNDLARIEPGRTQYTMMLNRSGGVIDDLVVWRWADERSWILPNAANHERVMAAFAGEKAAAEATDLRPSTVTMAVQGPEAPGILESVLGETPRRFRTLTGTFEGRPFWSAGTGYTGERGGEVTVPVETGPALADALTGAGATPCGLGARDTLRLEAGLPLWGQDLDETITPLEAGLDFAVSLDHEFVGREALQERLRTGPEKRRVAFRTGDRRIPRPHNPLRTDRSNGWVSSGNFSPVLGMGIGLGYLSPPDDAGPLEVEIRGRWIPVERATTPFVE